MKMDTEVRMEMGGVERGLGCYGDEIYLVR